MYPLNDKDLDRISRDAAEQFDVEPETSGWEQLEKRLNKELPQETKRRRFLFWLFFMAATTGGGLVWLLSTQNTSIKDQLSQQQQNTTTADASVNKTPEAKTGIDKTATTQPAGNKPAPHNAGRDITGPRPSGTFTEEAAVNPPAVKKNNGLPGAINNKPAPNSHTGDISADNKKAIVTNRQTISSPNHTPVIKPGNKQAAANDPQQVKDNTVTAGKEMNSGNKKAADSRQPDKNNASISATTDSLEAVSTAKEKKVPVDALTGPDKTDTADMPATGTVTTDTAVAIINTGKKTSRSKKPVKQRWEFGLVAGPDFSYVKFKESYKTGYNFGLQVQYRISDRWAFNTGLLYTHKNYKAEGEDFHPPKHYWINYVDLDKVEGNCNMFEIPLNVRYDVTVGKKSRSFLSTGLTSYIMTNQDYDYYYTYNGVYTMQNRKIDSTSNYMLSVLNISAGFEQSLGKRFSIQAEPYLKLPLKGLGFGSMMLDSYGIYLSLKYRPRFNK